MRVAVIGFSVRGAMGQYLEVLVREIGKHAKVYLFVPEFFCAEVSDVEVIRFKMSKHKVMALLRYIDLRQAWYVWKEILSVRPDVIYFFNGEGYPWTVAFTMWAKRQEIPTVVTVHDPELHPGASIWERLNSVLRTVVIKNVRSVHIHSRKFISTTEKMGARDIEVIPHLSFADRFLKFKRSGVQREEKLALFFGRIEPYKGLDLFVDAIVKLQGRMRAIIAGPGKIPKRVLKVIEQYPDLFDVKNRFIPDEEVSYLFQKASVLVLPYRQATQSSLPTLGAAFGLPVVATPVGAFIDDIPAVGGILVEPYPEELAKGILIAKEACNPVVPDSFTPERISEAFIKWFQRVIDE